MAGSILVADWSDETGFAEVSRALHAWEPRVELVAASDTAIFFEPDGTLYAVGLSASTLRFRHRTLGVGRGDALILPQGVAVESEPGLDFVGILHDGLAPFHFRERFIQSSGFEWAPAPDGPESGLHPIIPWEDARYRISYAELRASGSPLDVLDVGPDVHLLVVTSGEGVCELAGEAAPIRSGQVALIEAGLPYRLSGELTATRLRLEPELVYESRRFRDASAKGPKWSPEPTMPPIPDPEPA